MSNLYSRQHHYDTFQFVDGVEIICSITIDRQKLSKIAWRAAKNKNGKAISGPITIEAKKIDRGQLATVPAPE